mmetsp:Transcript_1330/g.3835  ORF Transcript_1330/g.3835 Transcript_1330/m.3835 type:complete len:332 (-) Transcript_1330:921-1916(-)
MHLRAPVARLGAPAALAVMAVAAALELALALALLRQRRHLLGVLRPDLQELRGGSGAGLGEVGVLVRLDALHLRRGGHGGGGLGVRPRGGGGGYGVRRRKVGDAGEGVGRGAHQRARCGVGRGREALPAETEGERHGHSREGRRRGRARGGGGRRELRREALDLLQLLQLADEVEVHAGRDEGLELQRRGLCDRHGRLQLVQELDLHGQRALRLELLREGGGGGGAGRGGGGRHLLRVGALAARDRRRLRLMRVVRGEWRLEGRRVRSRVGPVLGPRQRPRGGQGRFTRGSGRVRVQVVGGGAVVAVARLVARTANHVVRAGTRRRGRSER